MLASAQKQKPGFSASAKGSSNKSSSKTGADSAEHGRTPSHSAHRAAEQSAAFDFSKISIHPHGETRIQTKLAVGHPGDRYEQEAERVSGEVMRTSTMQAAHSEAPTHAPRQLHRAGAGHAGAAAAPRVVHEVLRSPGQPLGEETRSFLEPRFGWNFSDVRVHTDAKAAASARAIGARAYTVGRDVAFAEGQYAPETPGGRKLLAHELTHVVQQTGSQHSATGPAQGLSSPASPYVARAGGGPGIEVEHVHDVNLWKWKADPALFDQRTTGIDGKETGRMRLLGMEAEAGIGAGIKFFLLNVEGRGEHVNAQVTFAAAGAELGVSAKEVKADAELVLVEGKVGGDVDVGGTRVNGSFVVGFSAGGELAISAHHFKLGLKALIGFEIEFGEEDVDVGPLPDLDYNPPENIPTKFRRSAHEEMPPLPKSPDKKPKKQPKKPTTRHHLVPKEEPIVRLGSSGDASSHFRTSKI
jgi:Domain of unknown function (DUF4157)